MTSALPRTTTTPLEALAICALCFGWAIATSTQSVLEGLGGETFSDDSLIGLVITEVVFAAVALLALHWRRFDVASLYPSPSLRGVCAGVLLYALSVYVGEMAAAPFATDQTQPIDAMLDDASVSLPAVITMALVNGAYEEIFLLGFLLRGLRGRGLSFAIGVSLLVRVLYHLYQGPEGAASVLGFGLVLSLAYVRKPSLFPVVFAHVLADILPFI